MPFRNVFLKKLYRREMKDFWLMAANWYGMENVSQLNCKKSEIIGTESSRHPNSIKKKSEIIGVKFGKITN